MLTEEQLKQRKGKITSSIVAACLGLDKRKSRIEAALEARGELPPRERTAAMERGDLLEDIVLGYPAHKFGLKWERPEFRSAEPWAGDSCDAVYSDEGGIVAIGEGKTAAMGMASKFGTEETDDIPETALLQSHWHLWHWPEVNVCWVPVLVGGYEFSFKLYKVTRDEALIRTMRDELFEFWKRYVHGNDVPEPSELDSDWLEQRWAQGMRWAPDTLELRELCVAKAHATHQKMLATAEEERLKALIKNHLKDAQGCRAQWGSVYWRRPKGSAKTDWKALALELAGGDVPQELLGRHTAITIPSRRLSVHLKDGIDE